MGFSVALILADDGLYFPLFGAGELYRRLVSLLFGQSHLPPFRELRECGPQEQQTVLFRQRFHRQGAQLVNAHGGIVMFRRTCFLALIPPRRIGVNDVVSFLLYFLDGW
jgi:hypothetical protein